MWEQRTKLVPRAGPPFARCAESTNILRSGNLLGRAILIVRNMELTVQIPDELASRMSASGGDLSRRALEALALEEFKSRRITKPELRQLLGFGTGYRLDEFLKSHG